MNMGNNSKSLRTSCCFQRDKSKILPFDSLIEHLLNWNDVGIAKSLISEHWKSQISKHNRSNEENVKKLLNDVLCIVLYPSANLLVFCTAQLSRLSPVGVENANIASLLQKAAFLRNEIHSLTQIHLKIKEIHASLCCYKQSPTPVLQDTHLPLINLAQLVTNMRANGLLTPINNMPSVANAVSNDVRNGSVAALNTRPS